MSRCRTRAYLSGEDDTFSRRGLATEVDSSLPGSRIVQALDRLGDQRERPEELILDNGPEFIGRTLAQWADTHDVRLHFITPGKPIQNAHVESFHGRFRDEYLNEAWFLTIADSRGIIAAWRHDYNTRRPHSVLGYLTPEEFEQLSPSGECGTQEAKQKDGRCLSPATRVSLGAPESP